MPVIHSLRQLTKPRSYGQETAKEYADGFSQHETDHNSQAIGGQQAMRPACRKKDAGISQGKGGQDEESDRFVEPVLEPFGRIGGFGRGGTRGRNLPEGEGK